MNTSTTAVLVLLGAALAAPGHSAELRGQVTVLNRGGETPLKSFANALVFVADVRTALPQAPAVMEQKGKQYLPRLLAVQTGQTVRFVNRDRVQHNTFSPHEHEPFDLSRYPQGEFRTHVFRTPGRHKIYCDIHQNMVSDVVVVANRHFAVTTEDGSFVIRDLPAGAYTVKVWHVFGGTAEALVEVAASGASRDFVVTSRKLVGEIKKHKDKRGRSYRKRRRSTSGGGRDYD